MAERFVETDRQSAPLLSRYPEEHVEPGSLAAFVREMVESMDLSSLEGKYSARGRRAYSPRCLMAAWIYGYATGISSSRKLEEACRYDLRLHLVTDGVRPDHDESDKVGGVSGSEVRVNTTDPDSRIMRTAKRSYQQGYNAQAGVDPESMLVVTQDVSAAANDKKEVEGAVQAMRNLPPSLGEPTGLVADAGYYGAENLERCEKAGVTSYIAPGRKLPDRTSARSAKSAAARRNAERLATPEGAAVYADRKASVETVFGVMRNVMKFETFRLRRLNGAKLEWKLACMAWNFKRMHSLLAPA